jgi:hypothetical protein
MATTSTCVGLRKEDILWLYISDSVFAIFEISLSSTSVPSARSNMHSYEQPMREVTKGM